MRRGDYYLAYVVLQDEMGPEAVENSDDPWVRLVYLMYLMQMGQDMVFNNQEYQAIDIFESILEKEPGNTTAAKWVQKAKIKLASKAVARGDEHQRSGELSEALMAYHDAIGHVPDYPPALKGVEAVIKQVQAREARADDQYIRGVAALGERLYGVTWYHMINAIELNPEHEQARSKRDAVAARMTRDRYERALTLEDGGYYGAALKEYQAIQQRAPDFAGLTSRIERMRREVETERLIRDAEMAGFRNQYIKAREILEKAFETTSLQQAKISDLLLLVKEREAEDKYQRARILELEYHLEEALTAYQEIDSTWQFEEGFKDVKDRIADLSSTVQVASEAYAKGVEAEQAGNLEEAVDAYKEALLVYPGYRSLDKKVEDLEAKIKTGSGS